MEMPNRTGLKAPNDGWLVIKNKNKRRARRTEARVEETDRPAFFQNTDPPEFRQFGYVEWNSSTRALAEFLAALGVVDPGRTARYLLENFGSLSGLLEASWWRLRLVAGRRLTRVIRSSHDVMTTMLKEQVVEGPEIRRSEKLIDLLQAQVGFLDHEKVLALYADGQGRLMRIECIGEGSINATTVDRRALIGGALSIGASGFVLVHNHPGGNPQPTGTDVHVSHELARLARDLDLTMLDHLIISRGKVQPIFYWWQEAQLAGKKCADD